MAKTVASFWIVARAPKFFCLPWTLVCNSPNLDYVVNNSFNRQLLIFVKWKGSAGRYVTPAGTNLK